MEIVRWARWLLLVLMGGAVVWSFLVPDAAGFQKPSLARIVFFHLPPAFLATGFLFTGAWFSFRYLRSKEPEWDMRAVACIEVGFLMACLTMASGILFSKVQWLAWWNWDPRQTSFLMVLLLFSAYFLLRMAFPDREKRAGSAAAYAVASVLPAVFLIFVFPRLPHVVNNSLHPNETIPDTITGGPAARPQVDVVEDPNNPPPPAKPETRGFDRNYTMVLFAVGGLLLATTIWTYRLRVRAGLLELEADLLNEGLDDRGDTAATGVVRPISLHDQGGGTDYKG